MSRRPPWERQNNNNNRSPSPTDRATANDIRNMSGFSSLPSSTQNNILSAHTGNSIRAAQASVNYHLNRGSSGGGGGGSSSAYTPPSLAEMREYQQNVAGDILKLILNQAPEFAQQQWNEMQTYVPQQADLQYNIASEYVPLYAQMYRDQASMDRNENLATAVGGSMAVAPFIAAVRDQMRGQDATDMLGMLVQRANEGVAMGSRLSPDEMREVEQGVRASLTARGLNQGLGAAGSEGVARAMAGQNLLNQRMDRAMAVNSAVNQSNAGYNPFAIVAQNTTNIAPSTMAAAAGSAPQSISGIPYAASSVSGGVGAANNSLGQYMTAGQNFANAQAAAAQQAYQNSLQQQAINMQQTYYNYLMNK